MKVGYVLPSLQKPSGWRSHSIALLRAMRTYVDPVIFVSAADHPLALELFPKAQLFILPSTQGAFLGSPAGAQKLWETYRAIAGGSYPQMDLIHSLEAYPTGLVGSWLAGSIRRPHVITTHGTYGVVWYNFIPDRWVYQQVLHRTRLICPVSHGTARLVQQYFGAHLGKTLVRPILNGNDFYREVPQAAALGRTLPAIPTLLSVGDVKPRKGQMLSLQAFEKVRQRLPQARYEILGRADGEYAGELQKYIAAHGLQDCVRLSGAVSDEALQRAYETASVLVLTPQADNLHFEGFGLVYLEAGAYGVPVVATRTGGVPDAVKDGVTGYLAEPGDVAGIAEALLRLLEDPSLNRRMGRANRQWAETLTWEGTAKEQWSSYCEILEGTPA